MLFTKSRLFIQHAWMCMIRHTIQGVVHPLLGGRWTWEMLRGRGRVDPTYRGIAPETATPKGWDGGAVNLGTGHVFMFYFPASIYF